MHRIGDRPGVPVRKPSPRGVSRGPTSGGPGEPGPARAREAPLCNAGRWAGAPAVQGPGVSARLGLFLEVRREVCGDCLRVFGSGKPCVSACTEQEPGPGAVLRAALVAVRGSVQQPQPPSDGVGGEDRVGEGSRVLKLCPHHQLLLSGGASSKGGSGLPRPLRSPSGRTSPHLVCTLLGSLHPGTLFPPPLAPREGPSSRAPG